MRLISGAEMVVSYMLLTGLIVLFFCAKTKRPEFFVIIVMALVLILILALVVVNVGTLYRMRYGNLQILTGLGLLGWGMLWQKFKD